MNRKGNERKIRVLYWENGVAVHLTVPPHVPPDFNILGTSPQVSNYSLHLERACGFRLMMETMEWIYLKSHWSERLFLKNRSRITRFWDWLKCQYLWKAMMNTDDDRPKKWIKLICTILELLIKYFSFQNATINAQWMRRIFHWRFENMIAIPSTDHREADQYAISSNQGHQLFSILWYFKKTLILNICFEIFEKAYNIRQPSILIFWKDTPMMLHRTLVSEIQLNSIEEKMETFLRWLINFEVYILTKGTFLNTTNFFKHVIIQVR